VRELRTAVPALVRHRGQRYQPPFPDPVTTFGLRRLIGELAPDLVHSHGWISFSAAAALLGRRTPLVVSAHDYGYFCPTRTLLRNGEALCSGPGPAKCPPCAARYYGAPRGLVTAPSVALSRRLLARKLAGLHSVGSFVEEVTAPYLLGSVAAAGKRRVVSATIPSFEGPEPDLGEGGEAPEVGPFISRLPDEPFILFVGAFRRVKGLETLFAAYERLPSPPPLVLMGTFERDTPKRFPANSVVIEDVPHPAVMAAWDRAMFGVMPSLLAEPFGLTVAEAMSRGRPVIGTFPGGHADIVDPDSGILVPQGDAEALAEAMAKLIADPEMRERLGRSGAERAREFEASAVLPRFERLYREVLEARGGRPASG
jgi:glycosyltransferase involved in cell wall biosynthesis